MNIRNTKLVIFLINPPYRYKDNEKLTVNKMVLIQTSFSEEEQQVKSELLLKTMKTEDEGEYQCAYQSGLDMQIKKSQNITLHQYGTCCQPVSTCVNLCQHTCVAVLLTVKRLSSC